MSPSFRRMLQRVKGNCLVEFDRGPKIPERVAGYAVDFNESLILVQQLDWDAFVLNGYSVIRTTDVRNHRSFDKEGFWQTKAAKRKKFRPSNPGIALTDWQTAISEVEMKFPLFSVEKEIASPGKLYIGKLTALTGKTVAMRELDPNGDWRGSFRVRVADITRLQFGGGYESVLSLATEQG